MKIYLYAPFKPLNHPNPSGDRIIGNSIVRFLKKKGHDVVIPSHFRMRWFYLKPLKWPTLLKELFKITALLKKEKPDIWMTYHTYYKAPDIIGPLLCRIFSIPYVIFQGIYSTKRSRRIKTLPGFLLNRIALTSATHLFTNRVDDEKNLKRLIPSHKLTYVAPGIFPNDFNFDIKARTHLRKSWGVKDTKVILTAAMFRPDVKTQGLAWLIRCCGELKKKGHAFHLMIAGEGSERIYLETLAQKHLPDCHRFVGKIDRKKIYQFYSAGDIFAFPGINESLGMVYIEAQSCGLPIIAFNNGGIPEVVKDKSSGFLIPLFDSILFEKSLLRLLLSDKICSKMGTFAKTYVRTQHDLNKNYEKMNDILTQINCQRKKNDHK